MEPIRVFIADDHQLVRYALRNMLEGEVGIEVVGEAHDTQSAIDGVCETKPHVLLLDLRMPGGGGVEVCKRVKEACGPVSVLVLTSFDEDEELFGVLDAGAAGYLLKDSHPERIVSAVRSVSDGQAVFDSSIAARVIAGRATSNAEGGPIDSLSDREREVLSLMAKGLSNKQIGRTLWIGETTVKTHVSRILRKLDCQDRTQAVLAAVRAGVVDIEEPQGSAP